MSAPELPDDDEAGKGRSFETTHWHVVLAAAGSGPEAEAALEDLCQAYWYPLYAYARRAGTSGHEAEDLTQDFFARFLEKNSFAQGDQAVGRFRNFLLVAFKHFATQEWRKVHRKKRGGDYQVVPFDEQQAEAWYQEEPATKTTPDALYHRAFANEVLDRGMARLETEWRRRKDLFEKLKEFLTAEPDRGTYAKLGIELNMSEGAVKMAVHRLRLRFGELVRGEVASTVAQPEDVEDELHMLYTALSGA